MRQARPTLTLVTRGNSRSRRRLRCACRQCQASAPNLRKSQRHLPTQLGKGWDSQDPPRLRIGKGWFDTRGNVITL
eukprot:4968063-Pleurochrysis_carterae.AAC.3